MTVADRSPVRRLTMLLQMASPMLPVGAFAYSQGIERGVARRLDPSADGCAALDRRRRSADRSRAGKRRSGCACTARPSPATSDVPRMERALRRQPRDERASRGDAADGRVARRVGVRPADCRAARRCARSRSFRFRRRSPRAPRPAHRRAGGLTAYAWSWIENQVTAAMKAVPLGQVAGQRLLLAAHDDARRGGANGVRLDDDELVFGSAGPHARVRAPRDAVLATVPLVTRWNEERFER